GGLPPGATLRRVHAVRPAAAASRAQFRGAYARARAVGSGDLAHVPTRGHQRSVRTRGMGRPRARRSVDHAGRGYALTGFPGGDLLWGIADRRCGAPIEGRTTLKEKRSCTWGPSEVTHSGTRTLWENFACGSSGALTRRR